jgi:hypothetical protein
MILLKLERVYFCFARDEEDSITENLLCPDSILSDTLGLKKAVISISENFIESDWDKGDDEREESYEKRAFILNKELKKEKQEGQLWEDFYRDNREKVSLETLLESFRIDRFGREEGSIYLSFYPLPKEEITKPQMIEWEILEEVSKWS